MKSYTKYISTCVHFKKNMFMCVQTDLWNIWVLSLFPYLYGGQIMRFQCTPDPPHWQFLWGVGMILKWPSLFNAKNTHGVFTSTNEFFSAKPETDSSYHFYCLLPIPSSVESILNSLQLSILHIHPSHFSSCLFVTDLSIFSSSAVYMAHT